MQECQILYKRLKHRSDQNQNEEINFVRLYLQADVQRDWNDVVVEDEPGDGGQHAGLCRHVFALADVPVVVLPRLVGVVDVVVVVVVVVKFEVRILKPLASEKSETFVRKKI